MALPGADFRAIEARGLESLREAGFKPEYFGIRRAADLLEAEADQRELAILTAAWLGGARLIDNIQVSLDGPI